MMKLRLAAFMLVASQLQAADEQTVYLNRSDLFAFTIGQQTGQAISQAVKIRRYAAHRQAAYAQLEALRAKLSRCGGCAERDLLAREIKALQDQLLREDGMMYGTFDALADSNPAVNAVKKLVGYGEVCERHLRNKLTEQIREGHGQRVRQGRARFSDHQTPVRVRQGALPGSEEEQGAIAHAVRAAQPVGGAGQAAGVSRINEAGARTEGAKRGVVLLRGHLA